MIPAMLAKINCNNDCSKHPSNQIINEWNNECDNDCSNDSKNDCNNYSIIDCIIDCSNDATDNCFGWWMVLFGIHWQLIHCFSANSVQKCLGFLRIPWQIRIDVISVNTYSHELNTVLSNIINLNIHIYSSVHIVQTVFNV